MLQQSLPIMCELIAGIVQHLLAPQDTIMPSPIRLGLLAMAAIRTLCIHFFVIRQTTIFLKLF